MTLQGLRTNIRVSLAYLRAWVEGQGAVTVDHLMEDAATVEISRMQIWQWIRHRARTAEGVVITRDLVAGMVTNETLRALADGSGAEVTRSKPPATSLSTAAWASSSRPF